MKFAKWVLYLCVLQATFTLAGTHWLIGALVWGFILSPIFEPKPSDSASSSPAPAHLSGTDLKT